MQRLRPEAEPSGRGVFKRELSNGVVGFGDVDPIVAARESFEFGQSDLDRAVGTSARGEDGREAFERLVEEDLDAVVDRKRADAADRVAGEFGGRFARQHRRLGVEEVLELAVVDLDVAGADDERGRPLDVEGKSFGDAARLAAESFCGKFDGRAGHGELFDPAVRIEAGETGFYAFDRHD